VQSALCINTMNLRTAIQTDNDGAPQLDLFNPNESQHERFLRFHLKYPQVYRLFEKFALQLLESGHKTMGSKMIIERIRWEVATQSMDDDGFKINNNYTCYYSRLFMKNNPQHGDCFETREIKRA